MKQLFHSRNVWQQFMTKTCWSLNFVISRSRSPSVWHHRLSDFAWIFFYRFCFVIWTILCEYCNSSSDFVWKHFTDHSDSIDIYSQSATKRNQNLKHMHINNGNIRFFLDKSTKNVWNYSGLSGLSSQRSLNTSFRRFLLFILFASVVVLLLQINLSSLFADFWSQGKILWNFSRINWLNVCLSGWMLNEKIINRINNVDLKWKAMNDQWSYEILIKNTIS